MNKVAREVAEKEINQWLDYKNIKEGKREAFKDSIGRLVEAVMDGCLTLREDKVLVQSLGFPTEGEAPVSELEYKPRIRVGAVQNHLKGVKADDADGRLVAYVAALTSKPKEVIKALDTEDFNISQAIAIFFL